MIPAERSLEWAAEQRFLVRQKQGIERRLEELDELLAAFPAIAIEGFAGDGATRLHPKGESAAPKGIAR